MLPDESRHGNENFMLKVIPIPDPRKGPITKETLAALRQNFLLIPSIGAFASEQHWIESTGVGAPVDGNSAKYWRDNGAIWQTTKDTFQYLVLERNPDGTFVRMPLNFSDQSFNYLGPITATFYRQYARHFPIIPRLVLKSMSRFDSARLNFGPRIAEDYPLGSIFPDPTTENGRVTLPNEIAFRFNPQTGAPEAFWITDYMKEYPFDYTPQEPPPPGSSQRLSDDELVNAVSSIVTTPMSVKDKASAIRQIAVA